MCRGCLSLAELSSVLAQAGAGLQGMQHKVVHMDVKPDNILLKRDKQSGRIIAKVLMGTRGGLDLHNSFFALMIRDLCIDNQGY